MFRPFYQHILIVLFGLSAHFAFGQYCEDSVTAYSLHYPVAIEHYAGGSCVQTDGSILNMGRAITPDGNKLCIVHTDVAGHFLAGKYIECSDPSITMALTTIISLPGGDIVIAGRLVLPDGSEKGILITRFTNDLTPTWSTLIRRNTPQPEAPSYSYKNWAMCCDEEENIYYCFRSEPGGNLIPPSIFFISLDGSGNLRWSKGIDDQVSLPGFNFYFNAGTVIGEKVIFLAQGYHSEHFPNPTFPSMYCVSFNRNNGSFEKMKIATTTISASTNAVGQDGNLEITPGGKNFYYAFGINTGPSTNNVIHVLLDTTLSILKSRMIKNSLVNYAASLPKLGPDGLLSVIASKDIQKGINFSSFVVVDSTDKAVISKKIDVSPFSAAELLPVLFDPTGERLILSAVDDAQSQDLWRVDFPIRGDSALYSCLGTDSSIVSVEDIELRNADVELDRLYSDVANVSSYTIQTSGFTTNSNPLCFVKSICNNLQIKGPLFSCTGTAQTFIAKKNEGCLKKISWQLEDVPATLISKTDTSITLSFSAPWQGRIEAQLDNCSIKASLPFTVHEPLSRFSLGADTTICPGATMKLVAPAGNASYSWNTGASGPELIVNSPGNYSVRVSDFCGNNITSSIHIGYSQQKPVTLSDTVICKGDSVFITLPENARSVSWLPAASSSGLNAYFVAPANSSLFLVTWNDEFNCSYSKRFNVLVNTCTNDIWIPGAFTPNGDGRNDIFKVTEAGRLRSFRLTVYNRWGEKLFSSTDPSWGWDGKYRGVLSDNGVYVWICSYQFRDGVQQVKKGTVTLIH